MILISSEVSVWQVWDNLRYFDRETMEELQYTPKEQGLYGWVNTYHNERAVVQGLRMVRDWLAQFDGDVVAARAAIGRYTALDMISDAMAGKASPPFIAGDERTFDFFLKIWQRRNMSRALVKVSHYHYMFFHVSPNIPFHRLVSMMRRLPDFLKMPPEEKPTMAIERLSAPKVSDDADAGFIAYVDARKFFGFIDPAQLGVPAQIWEFEKGVPPKRLK